jgi:hypothetical protein
MNSKGNDASNEDVPFEAEAREAKAQAKQDVLESLREHYAGEARGWRREEPSEAQAAHIAKQASRKAAFRAAAEAYWDAQAEAQAQDGQDK